MLSVYGADRDIPVTYQDVPAGFTEDWATDADLASAGFHRPAQAGEWDKPGQQPLDEMLVEGEQVIGPEVQAQLLRQSLFQVLRDPAGQIVATWDEGRWWTPSESKEFLRQIVAEMKGGADAPHMNREARRRAKRQARRRRPGGGA